MRTDQEIHFHATRETNEKYPINPTEILKQLEIYKEKLNEVKKLRAEFFNARFKELKDIEDEERMKEEKKLEEDEKKFIRMFDVVWDDNPDLKVPIHGKPMSGVEGLKFWLSDSLHYNGKFNLGVWGSRDIEWLMSLVSRKFDLDVPVSVHFDADGNARTKYERHQISFKLKELR